MMDLQTSVITILGFIAVFFGIKIGEHNMKKKVKKVVDHAVEKMDEDRIENHKKKIADIDARPITDDPASDLRDRLGDPDE